MKLLVRIVLALVIVVLAVIAAMVLSGNDFGLSTYINDDDKYSDLLSYEATDVVSKISLDFEVRFVNVELTDEALVTLEYHAHERDTWEFDLSGDTLSVTQKRARVFWFFSFGAISKELRTVTLYLPRESVFELEIQNDVGDITIDTNETVTLAYLGVASDTGAISLSDVNINAGIDLSTSTGRITLDHVTAGEAIFDVSTGRVTVEDFTFATLDIDNSTGDIILKSGSVTGALAADNSTGKITIENVTASSYDLKTSTGSIHATLPSWDDIALDLKTDVGSINVFGNDLGKSHTDSSGSVTFKARVSTGSIYLND